MADLLYIYGGESDKTIAFDCDQVFSYSLNLGAVQGENVSKINDQRRLNALAEEKATVYAEFIFRQNDLFLERDLVHRGSLSLYFLTDLACKRSEFFPTYADYCNVALMRERMPALNVDRIIIDSCSRSFCAAVKSAVQQVTIEEIHTRNESQNRLIVLLKNTLFFSKAFVLSLFSRLIQASGRDQLPKIPLRNVLNSHILSWKEQQNRLRQHTRRNLRAKTYSVEDDL